MNARDELADTVCTALDDVSASPAVTPMATDYVVADAILAAGYRKIFDGDCGLNNVEDPTDREAAEAWMRWANLAMNEDVGAIYAMKKMLTELGYRKPRTITTAEELDALPFESVIRDGDECVLERWGDLEESGWVTVMVASFVPRDQITLPATVLYEGAQP